MESSPVKSDVCSIIYIYIYIYFFFFFWVGEVKNLSLTLTYHASSASNFAKKGYVLFSLVNAIFGFILNDFIFGDFEYSFLSLRLII